MTDDGQPAGVGRLRLLAVNQAAADFYAVQLATPAAKVAQEFLIGRGFTGEHAQQFGIGFAPRGGHALRDHLRRSGFTDEEMQKAGLVRESGWDFFSGRLLWPIRDSAKGVLGFGGRRIFDDDRMPAKYINTPETAIYKKSSVLYGLDLARTHIGRLSQAVVVEGYTDVMAAHLSGVQTAVASCGTAFGDDHAKLLQRLMGDGNHGEIIFTFDGDAAGQKAALKVFAADDKFIAQTYVAVEPSGLDPCDLMQQQGPEAVRELVGRRVPLYEFVMANVVGQYDLDRPDARLLALREAAPLVASIRHSEMVGGYIRELAAMLGSDVEQVRQEVRRAAKSQRRLDSTEDAPNDGFPDPDDMALATQRTVLKLILQTPELVDFERSPLYLQDFTHPAYQAVFTGIAGALAEPGEASWPELVRQHCDPEFESLVVALVVEPLPMEPDERYVASYCANLALQRTNREIAELRSRLQRTNPVKDPDTYRPLWSSLVALETRRKEL
ncbi:MAG: DNA primase, partial [Propionibacterium sp.]